MYSIFVEEELRRTISDFDGELFRFGLLRAGHVTGSIDVLGRNLKTKQVRTMRDAVAAVTKPPVARTGGPADRRTDVATCSVAAEFLPLFSPIYVLSVQT